MKTTKIFNTQLEGRTQMKGNKGFTLIELAVVLAIIAVLAAILTPLVTSYIDQARNTRAQTDVRAIAQAYLLHLRDTGYYPIYADISNAQAGTEVEEDFSTSSNIPTLGGSWLTTATAADIGTHLNINKLNLDTSGIFSGGRVAYRGPYLDNLPDDPWGNAYLVNADNVDGTTNMAFAISAGSDGTLDTTRDQALSGASVTVGNDDLVARIR